MFMLEKGWLEEAKKLHPQRYLNALNTVGYKELFEVIDKKLSLALAIEKIRRNTRRYAKRQITWFNNGENYICFDPYDVAGIISYIENSLKNQK